MSTEPATTGSLQWRTVVARSFEALGLLVYAYLIGAVVLTFRLKNSGLPWGTDGVLSFPRDEVLAVGAKSVLVLAVLMLVGLALSGTWRLLTRDLPPGFNVDEDFEFPIDRTSQLLMWGSAGLIVFSGIATAIKEGIANASPVSGPTPFTNALLFASVAGLLWFSTHLGYNRTMRALVGPRWRSIGVILVLIAAFPLASAYDTRPKWPVAMLRLSDGQCLHGALISRGDGKYVLADQRHGALFVVPERRVESIRVSRRDVQARDLAISEADCAADMF